MQHHHLIRILALTLIVACASEESQREGPAPALVGLSADGTMNPSEADRCPVCAMSTADKPMASAVELEDGRTYYFCGTGCMLWANLHTEEYLAVGPEAISRAMTRDYFTGLPLDAAEAYWIAGSDVVGAMGPMLVPLADEADIATFRERHGGTRVFRLDDLDGDRWEALLGRKATGQ